MSAAVAGHRFELLAPGLLGELASARPTAECSLLSSLPGRTVLLADTLAAPAGPMLYARLTLPIALRPSSPDDPVFLRLRCPEVEDPAELTIAAGEALSRAGPSGISEGPARRWRRRVLFFLEDISPLVLRGDRAQPHHVPAFAPGRLLSEVSRALEIAAAGHFGPDSVEVWSLVSLPADLFRPYLLAALERPAAAVFRLTAEDGPIPGQGRHIASTIPGLEAPEPVPADAGPFLGADGPAARAARLLAYTASSGPGCPQAGAPAGKWANTALRVRARHACQLVLTLSRRGGRSASQWCLVETLFLDPGPGAAVGLTRRPLVACDFAALAPPSRNPAPAAQAAASRPPAPAQAAASRPPAPAQQQQQQQQQQQPPLQPEPAAGASAVPLALEPDAGLAAGLAGVSFSLGLSEAERRARADVELPFTRAQTDSLFYGSPTAGSGATIAGTGATSAPAAGTLPALPPADWLFGVQVPWAPGPTGLIEYVYDEGDDFDEDEPDEDLEL
ncbi:hypothetical protein H696_01278 [Fonticula alba]|uniref:Elongator complex protein 5 n=1 Tax=Fonticula alba TaxID=691883 RepID=A0A058ZD53_FONAL|nr:hypothetical protein H696_01278 [Fonticula alba]KCV71866.1 hypothetical protein H696_01278 [Fonticula alba]|eukprot:XP_009493444.1 hypothetical protein H696_01278 [Fonticula alba]